MHNALYRYFGSRARGPRSLFLFRVTGAEEKAIQWLGALGWDEGEQWVLKRKYISQRDVHQGGMGKYIYERKKNQSAGKETYRDLCNKRTRTLSCRSEDFCVAKKESQSLCLVSWCTTDRRQQRKNLSALVSIEHEWPPGATSLGAKKHNKTKQNINIWCLPHLGRAQCFIEVSALWYADYLVTPSASACEARSTCVSRAASADANLMPCVSLPRWALFFTSPSFVCVPFPSTVSLMLSTRCLMEGEFHLITGLVAHLERHPQGFPWNLHLQRLQPNNLARDSVCCRCLFCRLPPWKNASATSQHFLKIKAPRASQW